jgi:hypothetical protein
MTVRSDSGQSRTRGDARWLRSKRSLGIMLILTPSLALLEFLLWREDIGFPRVSSDLEDQPPYPRT